MRTSESLTMASRKCSMIADVRFCAFSAVSPIFWTSARSSSATVCGDHRGKYKRRSARRSSVSQSDAGTKRRCLKQQGNQHSLTLPIQRVELSRRHLPQLPLGQFHPTSFCGRSLASGDTPKHPSLRPADVFQLYEREFYPPLKVEQHIGVTRPVCRRRFEWSFPASKAQS